MKHIKTGSKMNELVLLKKESHLTFTIDLQSDLYERVTANIKVVIV